MLNPLNLFGRVAVTSRALGRVQRKAFTAERRKVARALPTMNLLSWCGYAYLAAAVVLASLSFAASFGSVLTTFLLVHLLLWVLMSAVLVRRRKVLGLTGYQSFVLVAEALFVPAYAINMGKRVWAKQVFDLPAMTLGIRDAKRMQHEPERDLFAHQLRQRLNFMERARRRSDHEGACGRPGAGAGTARRGLPADDRPGTGAGGEGMPHGVRRLVRSMVWSRVWWRKAWRPVAAGWMLVVFGFGASAQGTGQLEPCARLDGIPFERLSCGCSLKLDTKGLCVKPGSANHPHLFTELHPDAPLLVVLDGKKTLLAHTSRSGRSVKGDPKGQWVDGYRGGDIEVLMRYRPAASTCPRGKPDGCEFVDVAVDVEWKQAGRALALTGRGTCESWGRNEGRWEGCRCSKG